MRFRPCLSALTLLAALCSFSSAADARCLNGIPSAEIAANVDVLTTHAGLTSTNFEVLASDEVDNAAAGMCDGERYIYINARWIRGIFDGIWDWNKTSVLAHEVGHHVLGHTVSREHSRKDELEADRYSGHVLFRMGASLEQAVTMVSHLPEEASRTHPKRSDRIAAVTAGWKNARNPTPVILASHHFPSMETHWENGLDIDAIAYGPTREGDDNKWHVVLTKKESGQQALVTRGRLRDLEQEINGYWNRGYLVQNLYYLKDRWIVVMSKSEGYRSVGQKWTVSDDPDDIENDIDAGYRDGFYISSLTHGEGTFALVMTEGSAGQIIRGESEYSSIRTILHEWWDEHYFITSLLYVRDYGWILVMTEGDESRNERVRHRSYFPEELIEFFAGEGFRVADLAYDGRYWIMVMSTRDMTLQR